MPHAVRIYADERGRCPFLEWLESLRDVRAVARTHDRLERLKHGNLGDCKSIGGGLFELRFTFRPGYRVYFGWVGSTVVVVLAGGDKASQDRDIRKARELWLDHRRRFGDA